MPPPPPLFTLFIIIDMTLMMGEMLQKNGVLLPFNLTHSFFIHFHVKTVVKYLAKINFLEIVWVRRVRVRIII